MPARKLAATAVAAPVPAEAATLSAPAPKAASEPAAPKAPAKVAPKTAVKATPKAAPKAAQKAPAAPVKAVKAAEAAKPEKPAKQAKPPKPAKAPKLRSKPVRDSFTMPEADFALIATLKARTLAAQRETKKSELLRAGLHALAALDTPALVAALNQLDPVKIGRPRKGG